MKKSEEIMREIDEIKKQQQELRNQLELVRKEEAKKVSTFRDIPNSIGNRWKLFHIFPFYDQVLISIHTRKRSGNVVLRENSHCTPHEFSKIRDIAKYITNYKVFATRSDGWVEQRTIKRNIKELDDTEFKLVVECAEEIVNVLYDYKMKCEEYQRIDNSDFVIERGDTYET